MKQLTISGLEFLMPDIPLPGVSVQPMQPCGPAPTEAFSLPLEVLKALHNASSSRWDKRRSYEWQLSYAFWTVLVGFIATVLFGKDTRFTSPGNAALIVSLLIIWGLHAYYLVNMVSRTLGDLKAQTEIEKAIDDLAPSGIRPFLGAGMDNHHWAAQRYGAWSQLGITATLCVAAWWFSSHRPNADSTPAQFVAPPITITCPTLQAPAAISPAQPARKKSTVGQKKRSRQP